ncbi:DUF418 domain-containing protein [Sphingomonas arantia]|uniref:DUF418 domain-containing protein n=1 Tax=Sphingomonas arantia TaxID=1460676 RepID=A0ABW4U224_9SPHN
MRPDAERIVTLDVLRGLAVMGILLMNIGGFALPEGAYFNPDAVAVHGPADRPIWLAQFVLIDGKLRNIFSLLFGAGILLVIDRAIAAGRDEGVVHIRRMAVLALFGLAHAYLLWWGDILFQYAVLGTLAVFVADRRPAALVRLALLCLLLHAILSATSLFGLASLRANPADWSTIAPQIGAVDRPAIAAEIHRMHGNYPALLRHRITVDLGLPFAMLIGNGLETLGMMLLGMAGLRSGFLTGAWSRLRYRQIALVGYAIALPAMLLLAGWAIRSGFDPVVNLGVTTVWSLPFRPLLALAHVALAMLIVGDGAVRTRIAAVGRGAFTNYLGTSLLMTTLFYGYGFGLFGRLDRLQLLAVVVATWAIMLLWSKPWLDRHRHGPLEWAWRTLAGTYRQPRSD